MHHGFFSAVVLIEFLNSTSFSVNEGEVASFCVALTGSLQRTVLFSIISSNLTTLNSADSGTIIWHYLIRETRKGS